MAASIAHVLGQLPCWTPDAVLLERYHHQHDEAAFAALVARHGTLVLRLCRRILGDAHDAEDAFQATFLILARKAHSLKQPDALPAWLYGVARRVALKTRCRSSRHAAAPLDEALLDPCPDPLTQLTAREVLDILDEEVRRLPASQRSAFVLCCLEGHTQDEAARILGSTVGSIKGLLERGRRRLQSRLTRRGIALSAALALVTVARDQVSARVPVLFLQSTVRAALGGSLGSTASALAHSVLKAMFLSKLAGAVGVVLTIVLATSATVVLIYRGAVGETPEDDKRAGFATPKDADSGKPNARADAFGDPLPTGAIARFGTVRFRHAARIALMAFTPDGKRLVSRGDDGVRVWDTVTGKELRHFAADAGRVGFSIDTDLSPDGKRVAVAGYGADGVIQFWDLDSGKKTGTLGSKMRPLVRFSPDGKLLATSATPTDIELWDVIARTKLRSWTVSPGWVSLIAFSADSRRLLTASVLTDEIRLWDVATGRLLQEFAPPGKINRGYYRDPFPMALSPDGSLLAIRDWGDRIDTAPGKVEWKTGIKLRDSATGKTVRRLTCPTSVNGVGVIPGFHALTFTLDGKRLVTGGPDHFIRIWDVRTGEELRRIPLESGPSEFLSLSRDGKKLAAVVGGDGNAIRVLDLTSGEAAAPTDAHFGSIIQVALSPDGRTAVTIGPEALGRFTAGPLSYLYIWDTATGRIRHRLDGHGTPFFWLQLGEDGCTLFSSEDKTMRVWDVASGQERRRIAVPIHPRQYPALDRVDLTPDGKTLAVVDTAQTIHILDAANGRERQQFRWPNEIEGMKLTPDGRFLTMWSYDRKIRIWDVKAGRKAHEYSLPQAGNQRYDATVSPDGRLLAAMGVWSPLPPEQPMLMLMDLATGRIIRRINSPFFYTRALAFSPDGRTLAWTCFTDRAIHLLEVASGRECHRLAGHRGHITSLAFSADRRRLLSGCSDSTALVWDLSGTPVRSPVNNGRLEALWTDLASEDAARAYQAIHQLAASPSSATSFLRQRLNPAAGVDEKRLARLITDLDSDNFPTRQKATEELAKCDEQAVPAYRKVLEGKPSLELRRRLEDLLDKAQSAWWVASGERLRSLRAIEVLELAGTTEARNVLATLAAGADGARLTEEAKAARERLTKRAH